ncbi:hypothetical protein JQU17_22840 [Ponticoccus sp. SC2-23]|nr:hypothetical protein [Ponticoccus sp. SC6-9]MBM1223068.1 hypothetical protein [Ponticoccus sp. SC6-15]MBM1231982.1 hypothetical protein [Ponticoccus sp. SC6-38]MBM1232034.1 hypothetical protein [Ponticoccus sp. SC6-45]MBM1241001.1 hypothetical protein [Ponticoccus sp. SC6-49]MBM1241045.1 hypothetical protein [Ponticoccus sp. SC2-64]MBM1245558.1 hypothetical protein [Ponticoccus sp. SC6-42]MBM1254501.1 hypothetical protein [Ponticoccus sp. SC6-33]MBM1259009.1 hypothetical protein [Pontico
MTAAKSRTCIVIGNGPSLRGFDFHRLAGFTTLGMNAAYRHWDSIGWYPDYYACLDDQLIKTHHAEIERLYAQGLVKKVFVHGAFFEHHPHRLGHPDFTSFDQTSGYWFHHKDKALGLPKLYDQPAFRSADPSKITTGAHSVRYAAHLGHDRIVLLGIDLRYVEVLPEAEPTSEIGLMIKSTPKHNPNYFFDGYQKAGDLYNIPNPAVHNGELHPRSFELIPTDFAANNVPCTVYNANRQSILSDRDIFPFVPIEEVLGESTLGSVMVPCNKGEIDAILANLELWNQIEFSPSDSETMANRPALVFMFNNDSARSEQDRISRAFDANGMSRFFSRLCFEYLDLEGERDLYLRDYSQPVGDQGYKAGPNNQFFYAIRRISGYGRYTFLMETDCLPIRRGWLSRLQRMVDASEPFWIMGSAYRGTQMLSNAFVRHLNGNAVYAAGDPDFQTFVTEFWEHHTWRLVRDKDKRLAYDCILEIMFSPDNIRDQAVMETWKQSAHLFRYFDYLQNISGNADIANTDGSLIQDLRRNSPDTYILHNRTAHKIVLAQLSEAKFTPSLHPGSTLGHPRVLLIDMTAAGNGTATGEIKSNLLAHWPETAFLQIARHGAEGLATVRREGDRFVTAPITSDRGAKKVADAARLAIDAFAPDVVLYRPVPDTEALHRFAMAEIGRLQVPLVTWIMDDWPARMAQDAPDAWAQMEPDLSALLARSTTCLSISSAMSEAFVQRYGLPFRPIANGVDPADWLPIQRPEREDFVLRYAGGLAHDMNRESVLRVAAAVEALAREGTPIRFEISTQPWWLEQCKALFAPFTATRIDIADKNVAEYRHWLSEADALLIAYNFDDETLRYVRYSMANKMPECLASGAVVLAHGPMDVATIRYLDSTDAAVIVSRPEEEAIIAALRELAASPALRNTMAGKARDIAFTRHNLTRLRTELREILSVAAKMRQEVDPAPMAPDNEHDLLLSFAAARIMLDPVGSSRHLTNDPALASRIESALEAGGPKAEHFLRVRAWAKSRGFKKAS